MLTKPCHFRNIIILPATVLSFAFLLSSYGFAEVTQAGSEESTSRTEDDINKGVRLQIFLDRAGFSPGKIDGRPGEFTRQALALYREAQGTEATQDNAAQNADRMPDVGDISMASVDPVFIEYTVTEEDLKHVGEIPSDVKQKADLKFLPYRSALDALAEKFHADKNFIEELNEGKTDNISVGDTLRVPNVEPFELTAFMEPSEGSDATKATDTGNSEESKSDIGATNNADKEKEASKSATSVQIDTTTNMLKVYNEDRLIGAYPVTIGTGQNESPEGDWKVTAIAKMPTFRYDESMLKHGERSDDFHMLPPGPRNPVGVLWIQLNKTGIGIHGTEDPDSIGRSASAGCVRLANWDVVRFMSKIDKDVPVKIE